MSSRFILRRLPAWIVNGVTVTLGLALVQFSISLVAGWQAGQVAIATAVCASLADVVTTTDRVARRVLVAAVASTAAGTLFLAMRPIGVLLIPSVAVIVLGAMLLLSWGPKAGSVAFAAALSLVFAMSLPDSLGLTVDRFAWGLAGSAGYWIWAVATAQLLQPTWRNFALHSSADSLAKLLAAISKQIGHPSDAVWQSGILDQEAALAERLQVARDMIFANDADPFAQRETAILLHLMDLRDLAMASNLEAGLLPSPPLARRQAELLGRIVARISDALHCVAEHLRTGIGPVVDEEIEQSIQSMLDELEHAAASNPTISRTGASELLKGKLALLSSIRKLLESPLQAPLSCERDELRRYVTPDEWRLGAVTSNLRLKAPVLRHALRTCITATGAYAVSRAVPWAPHPQWVVLTVAAVMQGTLAQTLLRRNARVLGTLAGCVVVLLLTTSSSTLFLSGCFLLAAGVAHAFFGVRYAVTAGAAAVMAVLQTHLLAPTGGFGIIERFGDTVAGAALGWAFTFVLPTWERKALPGVLRRATDALGAYAIEALTMRDGADGLPRFARQQAYDAIRALGAIRSRSLNEPEDVRVPIAQLTAWLSAAYSVMSHLSNIRLALTLQSQDADRAALATAMSRVTSNIEAMLGASPAAPQVPLSPKDERALAAVPHLASRIRRALDDTSRVAAQASRIESLLCTPELQSKRTL